MNKFNSIFGQILQILPHQDFVRAVREARAERGVKGFSSWGQFVAMAFCHRIPAKSATHSGDFGHPAM
jgi:putative heme iron utilization protein